MPCVISYGPRNAKIAIVGEAPGSDEVRLGRPFVGASGRFLRVMLSDSGIDMSACRILNVMQVQPRNNDFGEFYYDKHRNEPRPELIAGWRRLEAELLELKPNLTIALGAEALFALTRKRGIKKWRGSVLSTKVGKVISTLHPAALLRGTKTRTYSRVEETRGGTGGYGDRPIVQIDLSRAATEQLSGTHHTQSLSVRVSPTHGEVLEWLRTHKDCERCAFDTETLGRRIRCLGFATDATSAFCIPFIRVNAPQESSQKDKTIRLVTPQADNPNYWTVEQEVQIIREVQSFFSSEKTKFIAQNVSFDAPLLELNFGLRIRNFWFDTMHAHHLAYPELPKSLDFLTSVYTKIGYYADYDSTDDRSTWIYNGHDCIATYQCVDPILLELKQLGLDSFYFHHIHPLVKTMATIQGQGVLIDVENRKKIAGPIREELEGFRKKFKDDYGLEFKKQVSVKQVKETLGRLGIPVPKRTYRGETTETTDEKAIQALMLKHEDEPFFQLLLDQREKQKFYGTYVTAKLDKDGRMRTSYDVSGTLTGRLASSKTLWGTGGNLQNIVKSSFRRVFVASPGHVLIHADLSQAEKRLVDWFSRNTPMINRYLTDPNFDVHRAKASEIYGVPESEVTPLQRNRAKACNHSGNYGIGWKQFAYIAKIPGDEAKVLLEKHQSCPYLQMWWQDIQEQLKRNRTLTNPFGRKRTFFGRLEQETFRQAYDWGPQSTVGDIINRACYCVEAAIPIGMGQIILQVHDEIDPEVLTTYVGEAVQILRNAMEIPIVVHKDLPPLTIPVEISVGPNWWDQKEITK